MTKNEMKYYLTLKYGASIDLNKVLKNKKLINEILKIDDSINNVEKIKIFIKNMGFKIKENSKIEVDACSTYRIEPMKVDVDKSLNEHITNESKAKEYQDYMHDRLNSKEYCRYLYRTKQLKSTRFK